VRLAAIERQTDARLPLPCPASTEEARAHQRLIAHWDQTLIPDARIQRNFDSTDVQILLEHCSARCVRLPVFDFFNSLLAGNHANWQPQPGAASMRRV
jgi:hypothetical protein